MRPLIILGSAVTASLLTMVAGVISGYVGFQQTSATSGEVTRVFLVIAALAVTAFAWWTRMTPDDKPEALLAGLVLGWLLNPSSWNGTSFGGRLVSDMTLAAILVDLVLWVIVSFVLVLALSRTSSVDAAR